MATWYERLKEVERTGPDGIPVTLALQWRYLPTGDRWLTVSWRTRLRPGGHSRRFYMYQGEPWSIDAHLALEIMSQFEKIGGLSPDLDDKVRRPRFDAYVSTDLDTAARSRLLREITMPQEDWGADPFFAVLEESTDWRKVMIGDRRSGRVTFRSTTTRRDYKPRRELRPGQRWFLDNSMQDTNVQQARELYHQLRRFVEGQSTSRPALSARPGRERDLIAERIRAWNESRGLSTRSGAAAS